MSEGSVNRGLVVGAGVFSIAFLANALVFSRNFDTAEEVARHLDENLTMLYIGAVLTMSAGVGFLWFLAHLRVRLMEMEGSPDALTALAFGAGILFVGLWWMSTPIDVGIAEYVGSDIDFTTYEAMRNIAHQVLLMSQMAVAVTLGVVFVMTRRVETWPRWTVWTTLGVAVTSVLTLVFPAFALLLPMWTVVFALAARQTGTAPVEGLLV